MFYNKEIVQIQFSCFTQPVQRPMFRSLNIPVCLGLLLASCMSFFYRVYSPATLPATFSLVGVPVTSGQAALFHPQWFRGYLPDYRLPNSRAS